MAEIKINVTEANDMMYALSLKANLLNVPIVYTDVSSDSAVLDEFITAYYDLRTMLFSYIEFLQQDIVRVREAVAALEEADAQSAAMVDTITSGMATEKK